MEIIRIFPITLTDIILFVTFIVLILYTWKTHQLKNETVKQNELNLCPVIIVDLDEGREGFIYENRGKGVALNIETENVILKVEDPAITYTLIFDTISYLLVNRKTIVRGKVFDDKGTDVGGFNIFFAHFNPVVAEYDFKIPIQYTDIFGSPYETILGCGKRGIRIIDFKKRKKVQTVGT